MCFKIYKKEDMYSEVRSCRGQRSEVFEGKDRQEIEIDVLLELPELCFDSPLFTPGDRESGRLEGGGGSTRRRLGGHERS